MKTCTARDGRARVDDVKKRSMMVVVAHTCG